MNIHLGDISVWQYAAVSVGGVVVKEGGMSSDWLRSNHLVGDLSIQSFEPQSIDQVLTSKPRPTRYHCELPWWTFSHPATAIISQESSRARSNTSAAPSTTTSKYSLLPV